MNILEKLREILLERSKNMNPDDFLIRGLWGMDLLYKPNSKERTFKYNIFITQTMSQGACYCYNKTSKIDKSLIGKDVREIETNNTDIEISILDAGFSAFRDKSINDYYLRGYSHEKAKIRAKIVVDEVVYQLPQMTKRKSPTVVNVGVVKNIIYELKKHGIEVLATDLDPNVINQTTDELHIEDGHQYTLEYIKNSDVALVSGMTLSTNSLSTILTTAKNSNTKVVIFAETGSWFGQVYCDEFGVDAVISEPFPFYIFSGESLIRLHRPS
jgi:uncharacterized UPF0146 family protein